MKRILVIDDEAKMRSQTVELLRLENYDVTEARNGREGVEAARRTPRAELAQAKALLERYKLLSSFMEETGRLPR